MDKRTDTSPRTTRRTFLRNAGLATAGVVVGDLARSSRFAAAAPRVVGANDRINWGLIGCGGMGMGHVVSIMSQVDAGTANCQFIAVCDIYDPRKEAAKAKTNGTVYHEYRKLLENKEIDAVLIATPEHWHAQMTIDALEASKDVYCEKPMTRTLEEAGKVFETAQRTKRILQIGAQACSDPRYKRAHELLPELGKVVWSQTSYCRNSRNGEWNDDYPIDPKADPTKNLDWNAFLGPAEKRPFDPERFFRWRKFWDYSSGIIGDLYPHRIHALMLVLGSEFPTRVAATGGIFVPREREWTTDKGVVKLPDREVPDTVNTLVDFPGGHSMLVAGCTVNETGLPTTIRGNQATMYLESRTSLQIRPERPYAEELEPIEERLDVSPNEFAPHESNFMECMRTRKAPNCGPEEAYPVMVTCALAEMSYRGSRVIQFDPKTKKVVG